MNCDFGKALTALIAFLKDLAPIAGVTIAAIGLSTWRRQLRGTTHHSAAFKAMRAAIELRNALRDVRRARLYRIPEDQTGTTENLLQAKYAEHRRRIDSFLKAVDNLQAAELDAAVLFGESAVRDALRPLYDASNRFMIDFEEHYQRELQRISSGGRRNADDIELVRTVYGDEKDAFGQSLETAYAGAEAFFTPHLRL